MSSKFGQKPPVGRIERESAERMSGKFGQKPPVGRIEQGLGRTNFKQVRAKTTRWKDRTCRPRWRFGLVSIATAQYNAASSSGVTFTEQEAMIISGLSGNEIYCLSKKGYAPGRIVVGNSVYSLGAVRGLTSGIRTLTGGEIHSLTALISDGRHAAITRLEKEATDHEASGVTGVTSELRGSAACTSSSHWAPPSTIARARSFSPRPAPARISTARSTPATNRDTSLLATSATPWAWAAD